ncbi:MAG: 2-phosphosulfolactate phosphatase, partial [Candidatus Eisenbacteria bacterium]|nr:2-phosphosulfolactate phosphatase [Candidatus Eisenbacteria bacterium]
MRIDLFVTPQEIPLFYTKGRRVVVVDILRACTSLCFALQSGVEQVIPVDSVEGAKQLQATLDRATALLAGEQDGAQVAGFDLGNSPGEFQSAELAGKTVLYALLSGPPLLTRSMEAVEKVLLSFVNMAPMVRYLTEKGDSELTVICGGYDGRFAMEDVVAAGMLIDLMGKGESELLNDGARAAWILYLAHRRDLSAMIRESAAGRALLEQGL